MAVAGKGKGFAFSMDAAAAITLLVAGMMMFTGIQNQQALSSGQTSTIVEDTLYALEASGYIAGTIDSNSPTQAAQLIRERLLLVLPQGFDANVTVTAFTAEEGQCASAQDFHACFPDSNRVTGKAGGAAGSVFVSGRKFFIRKQPPGDCNIAYASFGTAETMGQGYTGPGSMLGTGGGLVGAGAQFSEAEFEGIDTNITFDVNVTPDGPISCDQNVDITLSVSVPEDVRKPIDLMLVIDRSGSMSWGGRLSTSYANSVSLDSGGAYAFVADDAGGVRSVDISNPLIPVLADTYDPGTVVDLALDRNWVFAADISGTDQVFAINRTDPLNLTNTGSISVQTSNGIGAADGYAYLAGRANDTTGLIVINATNPASMSIAGVRATSSPRDVFVDGNYAYLADGSAGLRIIDISNKSSPEIRGTYNTPGTAYDVFVAGNYAYVADGSNGMVAVDVTNKLSPSFAGSYNTPGTAYSVFVDGNTAYVADRTVLFLLDVSNPAAITADANYVTPYNYFDVYERDGYAYLAAGSMGLITIDAQAGPRINNAKESAKTFVDYNGWKMPPDKLGMASFSSSATLDRNLTTDRNSVKQRIDALVANGGTNIETGVRSANMELISARHNPGALMFEVLLSDGQSTTGNSQSAANEADANGIVIFTIGFGEDADTAELTNIANITGGSYYSAGDANALIEVFSLITLRVAEIANDANVSVPVIPGQVVVDDANGIVQDGNLVFRAGTITKSSPFSVTYRLNFPCNNSSVCNASAFTFPGPGATFSYYDSNGVVHIIDFNDSTTVSFRSRDLNVEVTAGTILGKDNVLLDARVQNTGDLDANSTTLKFRLNDTNGEVLASYAVPTLCSQGTPGCTSSSTFYQSVGLNTEGVIYAALNDDNSISECPIGNYFVVNCYGGPSTQVYSVGYYAWRS